MRSTPVDFYQGKCHGGYHFGGISLIGEIQPHINNRYFNRIVCLGHSLGGAVASVIATIFQKGGYNLFINSIRGRFPRGIYALVYGTPPIFSLDISRETRNFITNIILRNDIVPKLGGLFDSLARFQARIVTHLLYYFHGVYNVPNEIELRGNLNEIIRRGIQTSRIPGNVIILDAERRNVAQGDNQRIICHRIEYIGIFSHVFSKYYNAIFLLIRDANNVYIEENIEYAHEPQYHYGNRLFELLVPIVLAFDMKQVLIPYAFYLFSRRYLIHDEIDERQLNEIAQLNNEIQARGLVNIMMQMIGARVNII